MLRFLALGSIIADLPRSRSKFSSCFKIFSMSLKDFLEGEIFNKANIPAAILCCGVPSVLLMACVCWNSKKGKGAFGCNKD